MTDDLLLELNRSLGNIDIVIESPSLLREPTEITSDMDLDEIRRFLNEA